MSISITKEQLVDVGKYILEGMTEDQACILADVSYKLLQDEKESNEIVLKYIEKKKTEFKYNHIKEIQKNKSEKNSQWLLEKLYPEEFGPKANKGGNEAPVNIISLIIQQIQHAQDPLVRKISRGVRHENGAGSESDAESRLASVTKILD